MRIVIRLGGSVIASPVNTDIITKYSEVVQILKNQNQELVVIIGGGNLAREFINIAKKLKLEEKDQDEIAISISRVYAQLFLKTITQIEDNKIALTLKDVVDCLDKGKIAVMGGLKPGITTDSVAALVAKQIRANLIVKGTNQDGVYNKDPKTHMNAIKFDELSYEDLPKILQENNHKAGIHQIVDPEAVKILKNENITLIIVNGFDPNNILAAVQGEKIGTKIS
ncbi:MAG: UMP kinase [Candidatus Bathyarchaeota archaeon]|jgi:uridylate kinase|nr:UMP kinase [Candidatus Bathyarchaeota archaeon]